MNIYVGNLSYTINESELRQAFEAHGEVSSAKIVTDRDTGRSKGFGFVEMPADDEANNAIEGLNGTDFAGRTITVNEARPRQPRRGGGGNFRNNNNNNNGNRW